MNCPICDSGLEKGEMLRFETLCDHIEDPNNERGLPLRPTYICKKRTCPLSGQMLFWDEFGEVYINKYEIYMELEKQFKHISSQNILEAQNSPGRKWAMEGTYSGTKYKLFRIGNYKWEIHRQHTCNEKGQVVKYKFFIQTFKHASPGWIYYSGFWHILILCIKQFNRTLKNWKEDHNDHEKRELLSNFKDLTERDKEDNYRIVFHWYVNTFYEELKEELSK